jgi:cytoskeleton protein RodZ
MRFVFDKESWLEVRDRDNKLIFSQRLAAGTEQVVSGEGPLSLVIGYAPGVQLFWRGQAVDLAPHTRGDVARLVLE